MNARKSNDGTLEARIITCWNVISGAVSEETCSTTKRLSIKYTCVVQENKGGSDRRLSYAAACKLLLSPHLLWAGVEVQLHQKREVVQSRLGLFGDLPDIHGDNRRARLVTFQATNSSAVANLRGRPARKTAPQEEFHLRPSVHY